VQRIATKALENNGLAKTYLGGSQRRLFLRDMDDSRVEHGTALRG
jgi:hypothetical protein